MCLPLLIVLGFATIDVANMIKSYLVLMHVSREGANAVAREPGTKGSTSWAASVNNDLSTVVGSASSVITSSNAAQWSILYSEVVWDTTPGACSGGPLASGAPDNYRIKRANTGWTGAVQWTYPSGGGLSQPSKIGGDGVCASASSDPQWNQGIKGLTTTGLRFHVVEVFYNYGPSKLTPIQNFISSMTSRVFYVRTAFLDVMGG
jgi:hypothetical protein